MRIGCTFARQVIKRGRRFLQVRGLGTYSVTDIRNLLSRKFVKCVCNKACRIRWRLGSGDLQNITPRTLTALRAFVRGSRRK